MIYLRWFKQRFVFLKRVLITLLDTLIYQKQSQFLLHKTNAHRCPHQAILFYNTLGRTLFMCKEFIALVTHNKIFKKSISIDGFDKKIAYKNLYKQGNNEILYPKSPMIQTDAVIIEDVFYEKIANSFLLAYQHESVTKDLSTEWDRISTEFRELFFDKNNKIIKESLENFRGDPSIYSKIFNNQYPYIQKKDGYTKSYLNAIDLVLEYHRFATKIEKEVLASVSESRAGNYLAINYRGKKISEQLLQNLVVANDIIKHVPFSNEKRNVVLDIGVGFGGSTRIMSYYTNNTTQILLDLPETLFLTAYYLKYNFPNKKIALLEDIYPYLDNLETIIDKYDFIIIPPFVLDYISDKSIDLVINASSLAFMSEEYLTYYLEQNKRVLKDGGYFYSLNTTENSEWGIGSHEWDYKADYLTVMYNYDNRFSYPQWLGKKIFK
jgi:putative sugar O-methyltransferase